MCAGDHEGWRRREAASCCRRRRCCRAALVVMLLVEWAMRLLQVCQHAGGWLRQQAAGVCQAQQEGLDARDEDLQAEAEADADEGKCFGQVRRQAGRHEQHKAA